MTTRFSDADPDRTWDGLDIAPDDPRGTTAVVRRPAGDGFEYLILHRSIRGIDYEGDWAWTAPSGARQPGEAVYPSALRELAEEAGVTGAELLPVDVSGSWAIFVADVPAGTPVDLVDPEHDRYEWVSAEEASGRVLPSHVAERSFGPATSRAAWRIGFRPMRYDDLPALVSWRNTSHVTPWFRDPPADVREARQRYGARIEGKEPIRMNVLEVGGRPVGYLQHYLVRDDPDDLAVIGDVEAVAIDYLIGEADLSGGGLGPQMIWRYVREVVLAEHPSAPRVIACPEPANTRSVRALDKAGFVPGRILEKPGGDEPEQLCTFDIHHVLGRAVTPGP